MLRGYLSGCTLVCLLAIPAGAQPNNETKLAAARQLGQAGVELYMKGDTAGALDKLRRAYSVHAAPTLGLWYGRALERSGKLVEASERYREAAGAALGSDASTAFRQAQADARKALEAVTPRISQLTLEPPVPEPDGLQVSLDGEELPTALLGVAIPVNPGAHVLKISVKGQSHEQTLQLTEGQPLAAKLALPAASKPRYRPSELDADARSALSRTQIVAVMHSAQAELNRCGRGRSGGAVASLAIRGQTGVVESAKIKLNDQFIAQLPSTRSAREQLTTLYSQCLSGVLQRTRFPVFQKDVLEIDYVFRFTSGTNQRAAAEPRR